MKQLNIKISDHFQKLLNRGMKRRKIKKKTHYIYTLVEEDASREPQVDLSIYDQLLGIGLKAPLNPSPRFGDDDELWS